MSNFIIELLEFLNTVPRMEEYLSSGDENI